MSHRGELGEYFSCQVEQLRGRAVRSLSSIPIAASRFCAACLVPQLRVHRGGNAPANHKSRSRHAGAMTRFMLFPSKSIPDSVHVEIISRYMVNRVLRTASQLFAKAKRSKVEMDVPGPRIRSDL